MARIVKLTERHDCREEIARDIQDHVPYFGTVVEYSCGNQFTWSDDQRDGRWHLSYTADGRTYRGVAESRVGAYLALIADRYGGLIAVITDKPEDREPTEGDPA